MKPKIKQYERFELESKDPVEFISPGGKSITAEPFEYLPVEFTYDCEGEESVRPTGAAVKLVRFFPDEPGVYKYDGGEFECVPGESHGYVEVSKRDSRYFAFTDGTSFCPIGINLAFISPFGKSNGKEFGRTGFRYLGLRQYERWFRECQKNGVNLVRVWLGHEYFCPDTEEAGRFDPIKLEKIEALASLAKKYGIKLKLTLEQFRYFDYSRTADSDSYADDVFRKFNKRLYIGDKRCESSAEWLSGGEWREKWLLKVRELARRFSGDPTIFGIELWNEMNCMPFEEMLDWNRYMLPLVKAMFPKQLVMNSLGSFDSDGSKRCYERFCWELSDIKQMHRYLDQGAQYEICRENPIDLIRGGMEMLAEPDKPFLVAETGAVNDCHSGPFRYYCADHRGILFCDLVYTPLFCGAAGCGHIWHWDDRYVESKNLYRYFKPLMKLCEGVEFDREDFHAELWEDGDMILLMLRGRTTVLGYLRNRHDNWMNTLRDLKETVPLEDKQIDVSLPGEPEVIPIWDDETAEVMYGSRLSVKKLRYGVLLRSTNIKHSK